MSHRRRVRRLAWRAARQRPPSAVVEAARDAAVARVMALLDGGDPPPLDPMLRAVIRADAAADGVDLSGAATVDRLTGDLVDRICDGLDVP